VNGLTGVQRRVLRFVMDYYIEHGQFPYTRIIADALDSHHSSVAMTLLRLQAKGYIARELNGPSKVLRDEEGYQVVAIGRFERVQK